MVIRDDHLGCYYLDNARCASARKYVRRAARTMNYARRVHLLLRPRLSLACCSRQPPCILQKKKKKKTIFDLRCMCTIIDPRAFKPLFITPIKWIMDLTNETVRVLRITRSNFIKIIALFFLFRTTSFVIIK